MWIGGAKTRALATDGHGHVLVGDAHIYCIWLLIDFVRALAGTHMANVRGQQPS